MDKGISDISEIRKILKNYVEVELPYDFKEGENIKYITLDKNTNSELFYDGGEYLRIGNERIFLQNGPSTWQFQTKIRNDENDIIYNSKIYVEKDEEEKINEDVLLLQKTIKAQQMVIEKMTKNIKEDKIKIQKYENIIQKLKK